MIETDRRLCWRRLSLRHRLWPALLAALLLAGGCGQSGPLSLPEQPGSAPAGETDQQQQQDDDEGADQDER